MVHLNDASTNFKLKKLKPLENDEKLERTNNLIPPPKWHDIRIGFDETSEATGKMMVSFAITEYDFVFDRPAKEMDLQELI